MTLLPVTSFSDYFRLTAEADVVARGFGYGFSSEQTHLPQVAQAPLWTQDLHDRIQQSEPFISVGSETARREVYIAPIMQELARQLHVRIRIEFSLDVTPQLRGTLDYLVQSQNNLLVIEAKNGEPARGFSQLTAELIALDQWKETPPEDTLYGAVSLGNIWQFGVLHRAEKRIVQDLNLFRVPADLPDLMRVLVAVLSGNPAAH